MQEKAVERQKALEAEASLLRQAFSRRAGGAEDAYAERCRQAEQLLAQQVRKAMKFIETAGQQDARFSNLHRVESVLLAPSCAHSTVHAYAWASLFSGPDTLQRFMWQDHLISAAMCQ